MTEAQEAAIQTFTFTLHAVTTDQPVESSPESA